MERFTRNIYGTPAENLRLLKWQETLHVTGSDKRKKEEKRTRKEGMGMEPAPLGEDCEGTKVPHILGSPHTSGEISLHGASAPEPGRRAQQLVYGRQNTGWPAQKPGTAALSSRLGHLSTDTGGGWELKLGLQRSNPGRGRTRFGCLETGLRERLD